MAMPRTIQVLNRMMQDRIIDRYAIGGAVAALNYVEARFTADLDIFIAFERASGSGLVTLGPIVSYLATLGYSEWRDEGLMIEGWPVQFLATSDRLDAEALIEAVEIDVDLGSGETIKTMVFSAEHIVAIALRTGRAKDYLRVNDFLDQAAVDLMRLRDMIQDHGLADKWAEFCRKTGRPDPLSLSEEP